MVSVSKITVNDWNPNEMSPEQYEMLLDNIMKVDFVDPVLVTKFKDEYDEKIRYRVVDGEHRFRAACDLGHKKVPIIVVDYDESTAKKQTIRMNKIRGSFNHKKFNKMIEAMLMGGELSSATAAFDLGFEDEEEFELYREAARSQLPNKEAKQEFDKRVKQAQTLDDIYTLVMILVKKYGDSIPANFMILSVGLGRSLWVKVDQRNIRRFEAKARQCLEEGYTFDSFLTRVLQSVNVEKFIAKHGKKLIPVEDDNATIEDYYQDDNEELQELVAEAD